MEGYTRMGLSDVEWFVRSWDWVAYACMWVICIIVFASGERALPYEVSLVFISCLALSMLHTKE